MNYNNLFEEKKMNTKEIIKELFYGLLPITIWSVIILSITMYEITIWNIFITSRFYVRNIAFLPCYLSIFIFIPFFVAGYFERKCKHYLSCSRYKYV